MRRRASEDTDQLLIRKHDSRHQTGNNLVVVLRNVVKIYESGAGRFIALKGINLTIGAGEFLAVVGKSGSGKSTLMNMITGIDKPTAGEVIIGETPIHLLSEGKIAIWRGNTVGIVFQFFQLLPTLTVLENIILPMDFCHKFSYRERRDRAYHLLEQVDLVEQANKLPSTLSGGQQQRVAIARALANDPPILVADEPTGNLDSNTAQSVFSLFEKLISQGKTIIMVTHDQDVVQQVSRTIYIVDGRITGDKLQQKITPPDNGRQTIEQITDVVARGGYDPKSVRQRVQIILRDPLSASTLLKQELLNAPKERDVREEVYQMILDEISTRAAKAEQAGQLDEARKLWKILVEATDV